ncbi:hypothetical protein [Vibrio harveyi]|uniref:hypothetical protein n=1 Tax=Vibrio harveyi TaxID=669 RepID=UPI0002DE1AA4|nr:hypothetical protein [Vibrio harveyi]
MTNNKIECSHDNSKETEYELWVAFDNAKKEQRRDNANKRGAALRKARKERERLAVESTTWQPEIKPYRRGQ